MAKNKKKEHERVNTFRVNLTRNELIHLRDVFSVTVPLDRDSTVSQMLATATNRSIVESGVWHKIATACVRAEIPVGDSAPDYVVVSVAQPQLNVMQVASEPVSVSSDEITQHDNSAETVFGKYLDDHKCTSENDV